MQTGAPRVRWSVIAVTHSWESLTLTSDPLHAQPRGFKLKRTLRSCHLARSHTSTTLSANGCFFWPRVNLLSTAASVEQFSPLSLWQTPPEKNSAARLAPCSVRMGKNTSSCQTTLSDIILKCAINLEIAAYAWKQKRRVCSLTLFWPTALNYWCVSLLFIAAYRVSCWGSCPRLEWNHLWRRYSPRWRRDRRGWGPARQWERWSGRCGWRSLWRWAGFPLGKPDQRAAERKREQEDY